MLNRSPSALIHFKWSIFLSVVSAFIILARTSTAWSAPLFADLTISVDWEGASLDDENLEAMRKFRREFPEVKLVHFLNAAYFTQPGVNAALVAQKIRSVILPIDEIGLHIHGWQDQFVDAGVEYRSFPTFWGTPSSIWRTGGFGHDVPISAYTVDELRTVIRRSIDILELNGFTGIKSFRAGGWMADSKVLEALVLEGINIDSSAVPSGYLKEKLEKMALYRYVIELWSKITPFAQPYQIELPSGRFITEYPDNVALADYSNEGHVLDVLKAHSKNANPNGERIYIHYGFHQESASRFLGRVRKAIYAVRNFANANNIKMTSATLSSRFVDCRDFFSSL